MEDRALACSKLVRKIVNLWIVIPTLELGKICQNQLKFYWVSILVFPFNITFAFWTTFSLHNNFFQETRRVLGFKNVYLSIHSKK